MPATALDPKTALVLIDFQKMLASFPMIHPFADVVKNAVRLASAFRRAKLPVVLVRVAPSPDGGDMLAVRVQQPRRLPPLPPEALEIVPELGPEPSDIIVTKKQPNAFYGTDLDLQLRRRGMTGIVLGGVVTSIGVDGTARAANERAYNVTFASDAITDVDQATHDLVMTKLFPRFGEIDTTDALLALMPSSSKG